MSALVNAGICSAKRSDDAGQTIQLCGQRHLRLQESSDGGGDHYAGDENTEPETKCHDRKPFPVTTGFLLRRHDDLGQAAASGTLQFRMSDGTECRLAA